ncbi:MAG: LysM peptidoglycan-binding domain-containing protein [Bacteroides sp.]|nr:LysM peptidoglycan-binding domain-containing protein [Bacteroides sp.]
MKMIKKILVSFLVATACFTNAFAQENQSYFLHTVEKGQSLYSISSMYGVSQADIVKLNPGSDEKIYIGRELRIPRTEANTQKETFHTIQAGETLYGLGVKYNVPATEISKANPGLSAQNFRIGQVIRIPQIKEEVAAQPVVETSIQEAVKPKCRDMHKVKRKETIFSISREYGITQEELIAANPELKDGKKLKKGSFLCIPFPNQQQAEQQEKVLSNDEVIALSNMDKKEVGSLKAAVVLPFLDGVPQSEALRMVEYYEGFLMAVDSLKRRGTSIELYTYNSGPESKSIDTLLHKAEMKEMDIIFGPLYQAHINPLAQFAKENNIRLVIPFTSKDNMVFNTPVIYQINTPQSYLYSEAYDHFVREFPNANVIFIEAADGSEEKAEFIKGMKDALKNRSIAMSSVMDTVTVHSLRGVINPEKVNVFVPTSGKNVTLIKTLPHLTLLVREMPQANIHLFGYPEWQTYTKDHLEAFFELDTYFYSSFYTNNLLPAAINFTHNYRRWYAKEMADRYPKYGMLGFDTAYYFLYGLARYGNNFEENLSLMDVNPIQTGFKFQRVNNWGGFINKKVFFVRFTKDYQLQKLDFD